VLLHLKKKFQEKVYQKAPKYLLEIAADTVAAIAIVKNSFDVGLCQDRIRDDVKDVGINWNWK
jgi:hypothetical protein